MDTFEVVVSLLGGVFVLFVGAGVGQLVKYQESLNLLIGIAENLAKQTPTTVDDEVIAKIKEALSNAEQNISED